MDTNSIYIFSLQISFWLNSLAILNNNKCKYFDYQQNAINKKDKYFTEGYSLINLPHIVYVFFN